jgi:hypothetical protein
MHTFIYGNEFEIGIDHKQLEAICKKGIDKAPARLQRILFDIAQYAPKVVYKKGKEIPVADLLSRDYKPIFQPV